jgi:hypothetical protein
VNDPYTPAQWRVILKNAHTALALDPTNERARSALKAAVAAVTAENQVTKAQEATAAQQPEPGTAGSAIVGAGEGATLGLASKLGNLLPGPSNTAYLSAARSAHPIAAFGGDLAGSAALATLLAKTPALAGVSPAAQGIIGGGLLGAGRGAVEAPSGERMAGGLIGGIVGAGTGYVAGKVVGKIAPVVSKIVKNLRAAPAALGAAAEGTPEEIAVAAKLGIPVASVRGRLGPTAVQASRAPLLERMPGTTRGFTAMGGPTPPVPTAPTLTEMQQGLTAQGMARQEGVLPYYPRGGSAEQALAPRPVASPTQTNGIPMGQLQLLLRASPEEFEAARAMFPPEVMDQIAQLRAQPHGLLP